MKVFMSFPWYTFVKLIKEWKERLDKKINITKHSTGFNDIFLQKRINKI